jgi:hypothetical protein
MRNHRWGTLGWLAVPVVMLTAAAAGSGTDETAPCCFTNDQFRGVCRVVPAADETCDGILAYLNNPNSIGKAYCDRTTIRGGWVRAGCGHEADRGAPTPPPGGDR